MTRTRHRPQTQAKTQAKNQTDTKTQTKTRPLSIPSRFRWYQICACFVCEESRPTKNVRFSYICGNSTNQKCMLELYMWNFNQPKMYACVVYVEFQPTRAVRLHQKLKSILARVQRTSDHLQVMSGQGETRSKTRYDTTKQVHFDRERLWQFALLVISYTTNFFVLLEDYIACMMCVTS